MSNFKFAVSYLPAVGPFASFYYVRQESSRLEPHVMNLFTRWGALLPDQGERGKESPSLSVSESNRERRLDLIKGPLSLSIHIFKIAGLLLQTVTSLAEDPESKIPSSESNELLFKRIQLIHSLIPPLIPLIERIRLYALTGIGSTLLTIPLTFGLMGQIGGGAVALEAVLKPNF